VAHALARMEALRADLAGSTPAFWCCAVGLVGCLVWWAGVRLVVGRSRGGPAGARLPGPAWSVLALFFAVGWVLVDQRVEGPTLLVITPGHGITLSDLVSLALAGPALRRLARSVRPVRSAG